MKVCPFGALEVKDSKVSVNAACKMCLLCVRKSENGEIECIEEEQKPAVDKSIWRGICVYVEHIEGEIHPVTYELIGKARELADKIGHKVYCLMMGENIEESAKQLLYYKADEIYVYDHKELRDFRQEPYTAVFEDFINNVKPCAILVGATTVGRQLAPRVAARFKTGLTADCTVLDIDSNTDLVQIRPAFGGNIMAQIATPYNRPQMATVRHKVMDTPKKLNTPYGNIKVCSIDEDKLLSKVEILSVEKKPKTESIDDAEIIVVAGRGIKKAEDLELVKNLADVLGGTFACTRPLVENGMCEAKRQIGLSGRTVRPKLIITCGVSGAIQFVSGMNSADTIVAINTDENAPIFNFAHYGIVGDIYEVLPRLTQMISKGEGING
ncbi:MAG: electron transfer flavoprotein subunit alpha/FixB family protein [Acutalibacteraceae bacterium]